MGSQATNPFRLESTGRAGGSLERSRARVNVAYQAIQNVIDRRDLAPVDMYKVSSIVKGEAFNRKWYE